VLLFRIGLRLASSAVALLIAALVLSRMSITVTGFIIVVVIFTAISALLEPLIRRGAQRYASAWSILVGLTATWLALLITDLLSDSLQIEGALTWILAALIVWVVSAAADLVFDGVLLRRRRALVRD
jgi:uncharacterized membrane protein YvlD (DUF360 family)